MVKSGSSYTEKVLYSFAGGTTDGQVPNGGLIADGSGDLFSTTNSGGANNLGTVFELVKSGSNYTEQVLYSFAGGTTDGAMPIAGLTANSSGDLFGTTSSGGAYSHGTVFELVKSGSNYSEQVLYSFAGGTTDGANPHAGLIADVSGDLFGTTQNGGANNAGTVFELVKSGSSYTEQLLYSFAGGTSDGANPYAGLTTDGRGDLFGTTQNGGPQNVGTVFELVKSGSSYAEKVLYFFAGGTFDGATPYAGLIIAGNGDLIGTSSSGGTYNHGTVFELVKSGSSYAEQLLYSFAGGTTDGLRPTAGLIADGSGNLIGTTLNGGANNNGTVFELPYVTVSPNTASGLPVASVGSNYSQTISASGGAGGTYAFTTTDPLDGLTLSSGGVLSGFPTAGGSFTFTVTATDSDGTTGSQTYTLFVLPISILTVTTTADTAAVNPANSPLDSSGNISLRSAIQFADANNLTATIDFANGIGNTITLTSALPQITSNLTIAGPGSGALAISGGSSWQIFRIAAGVTANITGLELTEGQDSTAGGGGAIDNLGTLYVNNCSLNNNAASKGGNGTTSGGGGAIENNGYLAVSDSTFQDNTATNSGSVVTGDGGAIYNTGTLVVCGSTFTSNHSINSDGAVGSYGTGGAIFTTGTLTLNGCNFVGNISDHEGGAIRGILSTSLTVDGCNFNSNQANEDFGGGGAIMVSDASLSSPLTVSVIASSFFDNSTNGNGGAILAYGDTNLTVTQCSFNQNAARTTVVGPAGKGGAIAQEALTTSTVVAISNCTFNNNTASQSGGGIYDTGGSTVMAAGVIVGCTFTNNTASHSGGGAYLSSRFHHLYE